MNNKFVIILMVLAAGIFGFYAYLGGLDSPEIAVVTSKTQFVAGKYYEGAADAKELGALFQQAAQLTESEQLPGILANIYYNNPEAQADTIKAFIGVAVSDTTRTLPAGYELRELPGSRRVVQVTSKAHYLLAPTKIYPALFDYLKNNKLKAKEQYLELFPEKDYAIVQVELIR